MLKIGMEYIYEVYRERSFSRAAEKLYVSQPALSTSIQKEELYWGCTFFDRSKNPVELTPDGEYLIAAIERMKEIQADVESHFEQLSLSRRKSLNIGAPAFFCTYILPNIVKSFKEIYPECKVNVIEASDKDLWNGMQSDAIDCCISVESGSSGMVAAPLTEEHILLAVPKHYEINRQLADLRLGKESMATEWDIKPDCPKVSIRAFADCPFLLLNKGNDMHERAYRIFRESRMEPTVFMTLEQMMTSYHMAMSGMGIAFVRAGFLNCGDDELCFYALDSKYTRRSVHLITKKNKDVSAALNAFAAHLNGFF